MTLPCINTSSHFKPVPSFSYPLLSTMMTNQRLFVTFLLLLPVLSIAFGNLPPNLGKFLASNFGQNPFSISKETTTRRTTTIDPGVALLQELGITRTTPKPFQIRPDQIPDVLSSALPVRSTSISCLHPYTGGNLELWFLIACFRRSFVWVLESLPMAMESP
jgi:hypothetical protein